MCVQQENEYWIVNPNIKSVYKIFDILKWAQDGTHHICNSNPDTEKIKALFKWIELFTYIAAYTLFYLPTHWKFIIPSVLFYLLS